MTARAISLVVLPVVVVVVKRARFGRDVADDAFQFVELGVRVFVVRREREERLDLDERAIGRPS